MASKNYTRISKFISLILRHKPETIGIKLDKHGWADVKELLKGVNISMEELEHIVDTDEKQRYSFNDNKTKIESFCQRGIHLAVFFSSYSQRCEEKVFTPSPMGEEIPFTIKYFSSV